jgi:hypothetical protein
VGHAILSRCFLLIAREFLLIETSHVIFSDPATRDVRIGDPEVMGLVLKKDGQRGRAYREPKEEISTRQSFRVYLLLHPISSIAWTLTPSLAPPKSLKMSVNSSQ